ncbi:hypothetical protein C5O19_21575 [Siphonobacter curvatus]|uniref:Uncharacterized protein n=1 Tax=Siphonobacter curvatus TaxID=2094562 RepID=A0A2S7IHG0_9BACT|nr:hypothetical protein C5O19_21575 [Siphonobacter curvatus]
MKIQSILFVLILVSFVANGQIKKDFLKSQITKSVFRNSPAIRPFNLEYDVNGGDRYQIKLKGQPLEQGKVRQFNTLKFSATVPILMRKRYYLISTVSFNGLKHIF